MNKKQKIFLGIGLGALALTAGGILFWRNRSREDEVLDPEITATDIDPETGKKAVGDNMAGGTTVGADVSSIGIGRVANIPLVARPIAASSLPFEPFNPLLTDENLKAWDVVSVVERVAPKGNGIYVLTFKNRKPVGVLKDGQQIAVETRNKDAAMFRGFTKIHKVWIDTNGKLAGVYIKLNAPSMVTNMIDNKFKNNEYAAEGDIVVLKHK